MARSRIHTHHRSSRCFALVVVMTLCAWLLSQLLGNPNQSAVLAPEPSQEWHVTVHSCNQLRCQQVSGTEVCSLVRMPLALVPDDGTAAAGFWTSDPQQLPCITVTPPESVLRLNAAGVTITQELHTATGCTEAIPDTPIPCKHCERGLFHIAVCDQCDSRRICTGNLTIYPLRLLSLDNNIASLPFDSQMLKEVGLSAPEQTFLAKIQQVTTTHLIKTRFLIGGPSYGLVHNLPMATVLPGTRFIYTSPSAFSNTAAALLRITNTSCQSSFDLQQASGASLADGTTKWVTASKRHIALMGSQAPVATAWHAASPDQLRGRFTQVHMTAHGHDEDSFGVQNGQPCSTAKFADFPNPFKVAELQFTKTVHRWMHLIGRHESQIRTQFRLDRRKPTVLVVDTLPGKLGLKTKKKKRVAKSIASQKFFPKQLFNLVEAGFNVIYAPHPLSAGHHRVGMKQLDALNGPPHSPKIHVATSEMYPSKVPLWEAADVIVGATSGAFHAASFLPHKPLVLFRPSPWHTSQKCSKSSWWPHRDDLLMGAKHAILFDERNVDFVRDVKAALNSRGDANMAKSRQQYFEKWRGPVDGFEDYRLAICMLVGIGDANDLGVEYEADMAEFTRIYKTFPKFRGRSLVIPTKESCKAIIPGTAKWHPYLQVSNENIVDA